MTDNTNRMEWLKLNDYAKTILPNKFIYHLLNFQYNRKISQKQDLV